MHCCTDRRTIITGLMSAAVTPAVTAAPLEAERADDANYMRIAIDEARRGDLPFGAVIVRDQTELVRARNIGRSTDDPTAHAEMTAIRRCLSAHGSSVLRGSTLYASGEPCVMCMGAILWCGVGRLVFAASIAQLSAKLGQIMISSAEIAGKAPFAHISITGGILAEEAISLFG
jgi:tRNA(adenine34) deaminase